jgi:hypothetical protein
MKKQHLKLCLWDLKNSNRKKTGRKHTTMRIVVGL